MDPKTLANLDPKLRETYERVMGASSMVASTTPNPAAAPVQVSAPVPPANTPGPVIDNTVLSSNFFNPSALPPANSQTPASAPIKAPETPAATTASPSLPIPPPSPTAPASSTPPSPSADNFAMNLAQPPQPPGLTNLQPNLIGVPSAEPKEASLELSKPLQPLPSPASVNLGAANANTAAPITSGPSGMIRTLYFVAGIIFFIIYAIFWLKIFHYPLPFNL